MITALSRPDGWRRCPQRPVWLRLSKRRGWRDQVGSTWASAERKVRDWPEWLNDAAEQPEWLGSAYLVGGSPGKVDDGSRGESQFHSGRSENQPLLGGVRSLHRLFDAMVHINARDRPGVTADCPSLPSLFVACLAADRRLQWRPL